MTSDLAAAVAVVRPAHFACNTETSATNRFQARTGGGEVARETARSEFDALTEKLVAAGVEVQIFEGNAQHALPDEVFSNNWLSTHPDGTVVTYPLQAPSRRLERRADVVEWLEHGSTYRVSRVLDLSFLEREGVYFEGTGSAVIDHRNGLAFCGCSERTSARGISAVTAALELEPVVFATRDRNGHIVYHTNVLLSIGATFVVVCLEAIAPEDRDRIARRLEASGRELLPITLEQMHEFAANLLALRSATGPVIALSARAWQAFDAAQKRTLERHGTIVASDIATIETLGGGSVRCMLTELLLPRAR